ncbi:hypothetical protein BJY01DRAFT_214168 [Aspergillus pseudoustus]|uniref:Zn(2)-C6 fungal-type domain-containing protein n=1 Tax=Aspergillus pseudoustus TaxID=1810923 RepID=A0ABR4K2V2_9EURO
MDTNSDTYPAPYGRACSNCSQSKCKCIYPKAGGRCQRCQRLNKECRKPASHKRQPRKSSHSKAARLEDKLEDLVSLLRAGVQPPGANPVNLLLGQLGQTQDTTLSNAISPPESLDAPISNATRSIYIMPPNQAAFTPDTNTSESGGQTSVSFSSPAEPTSLQAEEYLTLFHAQLLPYFPCVYIPPGTTAQQLRRDRPFTWLCIMAVTCKFAGQRRALYDKIKAIVAQQMIHNSANSDIDVLHGLLIYLGWSNQQVYNKANIHVFTQLAKAAVYELGIHNPSAKPKIMALCVYTEEDESAASVAGQSMEERRAVLACFLISSIISTFVQKTDSLRWTPFMDDCLRALEENQECLNDEFLAQQVRLQLITDKLNLGPYHGGLAETPDPIRAPPALYLRSMHAQLQSIQPRVAPQSQSYKILLLHHHYTSLTLNEAVLTNAPINSRNLNFQQLEHLYGCLEATKSWFELFLTIPPAEYIGFSFSIFAQMVHNLVMLYQLSTFEDPSWDITTVRQTTDVLSTLGTVIQNMSQVAILAGLDGEPDSDVFSRVAKMYRSIQMGWGVKLGPPELLPLQNIPSSQSFPEPLETMPINFPLTGDNDWLSDMLYSVTQNSQF